MHCKTISSPYLTALIIHPLHCFDFDLNLTFSSNWLKAWHPSGKGVEFLSKSNSHHIPLLLPGLQREHGGGGLFPVRVGKPLTPEEVGIVGDGGKLVDVEDLLVPAHAVQLLLQLPDPLVEGRVLGHGGGVGGGGGGGLDLKLASAELFELVENPRTSRGERVQRWTWKVLLISGLEDLQKRKIYKWINGKPKRFSDIKQCTFILCFPSGPRLRPSSLEATGSLGSSGVDCSCCPCCTCCPCCPASSPPVCPWGDVVVFCAGELFPNSRLSLLLVLAFTLLAALRLLMFTIVLGLSDEFRKRTLSLLCWRLLTSPLMRKRF